jgi:hypothetical protein
MAQRNARGFQAIQRLAALPLFLMLLKLILG